MNKLVFVLLCLISFNSFSDDSVFVDQKVLELKILIRSNSDSLDSEISLFHNLAKKENNNYALSQFHFLEGYRDVYRGNYENAIDHYSEAVFTCGDSSSHFSIDLLNRIGYCYKDLTNYQEAYRYFTLSLNLSLEKEYHKGSGDSYAGIGQIFESNSRYSEGMQYFLKALDAFSLVNDSTGIASSYNNIGNMMYYQGEYEQALDYYKKSARIDYLTKNQLNLSMGYGNIGMIYHQLGDLDSSIYYNELCLYYLEKLNRPFFLGTIYNNIALLYSDMDKIDESLEFHEKSRVIKEKIGDQSGLATTLVNIGNLLIQTEKFRESIPYYEECLIICNELDLPLIKMNASKGLSKAYRENGNFEEALNHYLIYNQIDDSINSVKAKDNVLALETEFETIQKDELLKQQKISHDQDLAINEAKAKTMQIIILSVSILFAFVVLFMIIFYRKLKLTREQKALIELKNKENELLLGEIHHRVKNNLQVISSLLSLQEKSVTDQSAKMAIVEGKERVKSMGLIHKMLYQNDNYSGIEMNKYILNLISGLMDSFGLDKENLELEISADEINLDVESAIPLGLIINELVINSFKYALQKTDSPRMIIQLKKEKEGLLLHVEDNGKGKTTDLTNSASFGTKLVNALVRQLRGEINLEDKEGLCYSILIKDYKLVS